MAVWDMTLMKKTRAFLFAVLAVAGTPSCSGTVESDSRRTGGTGAVANDGGPSGGESNGASGSRSSSPGGIAEPCVLNSDCDSPLVCVFGECHVQCLTSVDCAAGQACVV